MNVISETLNGPPQSTRTEPAPSVTLSANPFPRCPGETPRAFNAFMTWFQLGHARSLQAVADKLGEGLPTLKNWSSKYDWGERLQAFNSGLLQQAVQAETEQQRKRAADWASRLDHFREQEWEAAQKLISAVQCFLESFGDEQVGRMTLSQVSRALRISSVIGRSALLGAELPASATSAMSPLQQQLLEAVTRVYGQAAAARDKAPASPTTDPLTQPTATASNHEPHIQKAS